MKLYLFFWIFRNSNSLDGSEDDLFREYEYRKRKLNYWNWNDDVLCLGDDCVASSDSDE